VRSAKDAEFVFIRDKLALAKKLMEEKPSASMKPTVVPSTPTSKPSNWPGEYPPQGQGRRAAQRAEERRRRRAAGRGGKTKPEDDAYLSRDRAFCWITRKAPNRWPSSKMMAI
jgi:carboxyl-terminal processing protease